MRSCDQFLDLGSTDVIVSAGGEVAIGKEGILKPHPWTFKG